HFLPIRQKNAAVSESLDQLVMSMVELDASKRPESVHHVKNILQSLDYQQRMQRALPITPYPATSAFPSSAPQPQTLFYPAPGSFGAFGAPTHRTATSQPAMPLGFSPFGATAGSSTRSQLRVMGQMQVQQ